MVAFGPMFLHPSVGFDLANSVDTTGIAVMVFVPSESNTRLIRGEVAEIARWRIVRTEVNFNEWAPLRVKPDPKDPRRWFDGFRTAWQEPSPRGNQPATRPWRHQSRADALQRRRHKRKLFLESIHG